MLVLDGALDRRTLDVHVPERPPPLPADEKNEDGKRGVWVSERRRRRHGGGNERRDRAGDARSPPPGDGGGYPRRLAPDGTATPPMVAAAADDDDEDEIIEEPEPPRKEMSSSSRKRWKTAEGEENAAAVKEPTRNSADVVSAGEMDDERLPTSGDGDAEGERAAAAATTAVPTPEFLAGSLMRRGISHVVTDVNALRDEPGPGVVAVAGPPPREDEGRRRPASVRKVSDAEEGDGAGGDIGANNAVTGGRSSPRREARRVASRLLPRTAAASLALLLSNGMWATLSLVNALSRAAARAAASRSASPNVAAEPDRPLSATEGCEAAVPPVPPMLQASIGIESRLRHTAFFMVSRMTESVDERPLREFMGYKTSRRSSSSSKGAGGEGRSRLLRMVSDYLFDVSHAMFAGGGPGWGGTVP